MTSGVSIPASLWKGQTGRNVGKPGAYTEAWHEKPNTGHCGTKEEAPYWGSDLSELWTEQSTHGADSRCTGGPHIPAESKKPEQHADIVLGYFSTASSLPSRAAPVWDADLTGLAQVSVVSNTLQTSEYTHSVYKTLLLCQQALKMRTTGSDQTPTIYQ